ncbi:hypothetical protein [Clostridium sp. AM46-21]|uniref:hypothetical protein n=1 Tax=Clostridium sp. AM46-21 TaxID=2293033 RepID=UPI0015FA7065|nr:hypothetical protein [Clostridium sp. AM46-21]
MLIYFRSFNSSILYPVPDRTPLTCIVNINHVTSLSGSTIYLANKQTQMVGRNYLDDVRKALLRIAQ